MIRTYSEKCPVTEANENQANHCSGKPKASSKLKHYIKKENVKKAIKYPASRMIRMVSFTAEKKIARVPVQNSQLAVSLSFSVLF